MMFIFIKGLELDKRSNQFCSFLCSSLPEHVHVQSSKKTRFEK